MAFDKLRNLLGAFSLSAFDEPEHSRIQVSKMLDVSMRLKDQEPLTKETHLKQLSEGMLQVLDFEKDVSSGTLGNNLRAIADNMIDAMGTERAIVHTYLRHIRHADYGGAYDAGMAKRLHERFESSEGFSMKDPLKMLTYDSYFDDADGLSSLGNFMLKRMEERLIFDSVDVRQKKGLQNIVAPV